MNPLLNRKAFENGGFLRLTEPTTVIRRVEGGVNEETGTWIPVSWPGYREVLAAIDRAKLIPAPRAVPDAPSTSGVAQTDPPGGSGIQEQLGAPDERPDQASVGSQGQPSAATTPAPR